MMRHAIAAPGFHHGADHDMPPQVIRRHLVPFHADQLPELGPGQNAIAHLPRAEAQLGMRLAPHFLPEFGQFVDRDIAAKRAQLLLHLPGAAAITARNAKPVTAVPAAIPFEIIIFRTDREAAHRDAHFQQANEFHRRNRRHRRIARGRQPVDFHRRAKHREIHAARQRAVHRAHLHIDHRIGAHRQRLALHPVDRAAPAIDMPLRPAHAVMVPARARYRRQRAQSVAARQQQFGRRHRRKPRHLALGGVFQAFLDKFGQLVAVQRIGPGILAILRHGFAGFVGSRTFAKPSHPRPCP